MAIASRHYAVASMDDMDCRGYSNRVVDVAKRDAHTLASSVEAFVIDSPEPPQDNPASFTEEEHLLAAQLYLEHLYTTAFNEAALYGEAIRAVRRVGIITRSRQKEIAELERWYALNESDGGERATNRPDDDPGAPA